MQFHPELEPCQNLNCQNGGQCVNDLGVYRCSCQAGWTGTYCETSKFVYLEKKIKPTENR